MAKVVKKKATLAKVKLPKSKITGKGIWVPSKDRPPTTSVVAKRIAKEALRKGSLVLETDGKFRRISLAQKLRVDASANPSVIQTKRYLSYKGARTVGEFLKAGGLAGDLSYDARVGSLKFLPKLKGKEVEEPLAQSEWPPGIRPNDGHGPWWLPRNWAHGVKTTCRTYLPVFIAPDGRTVYHQEVVEAIVGKTLGGIDRIVEWAKQCIAEQQDWSGQAVQVVSDSKLFANLTAHERSHLPTASEFHFGVISARRASELSGIRGIVNVQVRLLSAGIQPRWYVDEASLQDYRRLGLDAVVGGKLTPARNKALQDAARMKKACVQVSDDISGWEFYMSTLDAAELRRKGAGAMLKAANKSRKASELMVSPSAAARFLLAKMRASTPRAHLGGVLPTGNGALALLAQMTTPDGFILGDFFVHDASPCRFDETLTLKEDYDFTCAHLERHGCVMRCNRMVLKVVHEKNAGGAVDTRDSNGDKERWNIKQLMKKWPGVFKLHSTRGDTQVKMKWSHRK